MPGNQTTTSKKVIVSPEEIIPSLLETWIVWRDFFSRSYDKPFGILKEKMGLKRMPLQVEWLNYNDDICPFCKGDRTIENPEFGVVWCFCEFLLRINELKEAHRTIATNINPASLDTIIYPNYMGEDYKMTMYPFVEGAKEFIRRPRKWLFVNGFVGGGKTHVFRAINSYMKPMSLYVASRDLEEMTHEYRKSDELTNFYKTLVSAPVLILDDLGMEYPGALVKSLIQKIVDARYERFPDFPIVASTNINMAFFPEYIPRASDRLLDKSRTDIYVLDAKASYRSVPVRSRK